MYQHVNTTLYEEADVNSATRSHVWCKQEVKRHNDCV